MVTSATSPITIGVNLLYLRPDHVGGSETYLRKVIAELERIERVTLVLFCSAECAARFDPGEGTTLVTVHAKPFSQGRRLWSENVSMRRQLALHPVDVLWSPANFIAPALPASAPQVATIHDLQHLWMPENFSLLQRVARDVLFRATLRRARAVIAISGFTRDDILARYGAEASRVHGILSGLDAAEAPGDEDEVRQRYDLQGPFLVFPAAMTPHKGHAFLLRAFARAVDGLDPRLRLVLTGQKTDLWPGLCAIIAEHGLEDRVHHLGFIPRGDMITLTAAATALVFPSRFEGFGLPLLEAMQHGTPVIASKVTAIPEVAGEGAALLDPDDLDAWASAMRRVVSEPEWAAELSRAGTENTRRFSWRTCAEATLTVLEQAARAN